jgi:hypothetical protein
LAQKKPKPIEKRRRREERGVSEYLNRLWRATDLCRSEEGEPCDGSDLTIVFQKSVSFL